MHKTLDPQTILIPAYTAATKSRVRCIPSSSIIIPHPDFPSVSENKQESFRNILIFTQDNWSSEKLHPMTINDHQWSSLIIIDHHHSSFIIIIIHHSSFIIHHHHSSFIIHHSPSSSPSYSYSSWIIIITTLGFFPTFRLPWGLQLSCGSGLRQKGLPKPLRWPWPGDERWAATMGYQKW